MYVMCICLITRFWLWCWFTEVFRDTRRTTGFIWVKVWVWQRVSGDNRTWSCINWAVLSQLGSTEIPSGVKTYPKNYTRSNQNSHLLNLAYSLCSLNRASTIQRCWACSSLFLEYIRISSMNTTTNLSSSGIKTEFMRYMKNAGALVKGPCVVLVIEWQPRWTERATKFDKLC